MKALGLLTSIAVTAWLTCPAAFAKGSGGGHGSGGHASGGHTSGSHSGGASASQRGARAATMAHTPPPLPGVTEQEDRGRRPVRPGGGAAAPPPPNQAQPGGSLTYLPSRAFPYYGMALGFGFGTLYDMGAMSSEYGNPGYDSSAWPDEGYGPPYQYGGYSDTGSLRLLVEPANAQVFVDSYYSGLVADFDGLFEHLDLPPGPHHVEIRERGYESLVFDVDIRAHHKTTYHGRLVPSER